MNSFSFSPPINLSEEGKWSLVVTSFEATNSVFNTTGENNSFSISTPGHWSSSGGAEVIKKLRKVLQMRHNNVIELHVEVRKSGNHIKIGDNENKLSDLETHKIQIINELKNAEYNDLEDMVFKWD